MTIISSKALRVSGENMKICSVRRTRGCTGRAAAMTPGSGPRAVRISDPRMGCGRCAWYALAWGCGGAVLVAVACCSLGHRRPRRLRRTNQREIADLPRPERKGKRLTELRAKRPGTTQGRWRARHGDLAEPGKALTFETRGAQGGLALFQGLCPALRPRRAITQPLRCRVGRGRIPRQMLLDRVAAVKEFQEGSVRLDVQTTQQARLVFPHEAEVAGREYRLTSNSFSGSRDVNSHRQLRKGMKVRY